MRKLLPVASVGCCQTIVLSLRAQSWVCRLGGRLPRDLSHPRSSRISVPVDLIALGRPPNVSHQIPCLVVSDSQQEILSRPRWCFSSSEDFSSAQFCLHALAGTEGDSVPTHAQQSLPPGIASEEETADQADPFTGLPELCGP